VKISFISSFSIHKEKNIKRKIVFYFQNYAVDKGEGLAKLLAVKIDSSYELILVGLQTLWDFLKMVRTLFPVLLCSSSG